MNLLATIWDTVTFYGPAGYSLLAVTASGLVALLAWALWKRFK